MGAKSNFNQATYELFGIGTDPNKVEEKVTAEEEVTELKAKNSEPQRMTIERVTPAANNEISIPYIKVPGDVEVAGEFIGDIYAEGKVTLHAGIKGNITARALELNHCALTGDINVNNKVVVCEKSLIQGKVFAEDMECAGSIKGDVLIKNELMLKATAEVTGNIQISSIITERGAKVHGSIELGGTKSL